MLEQLARVDRQVALEERPSLHPERGRASSLTRLAQELLSGDDSARLERAFAESLSKIALSIAEHFPDNIFWDLDFLAASLIEQARRAGRGGQEAALVSLHEATGLLVEVQALYGARSAIRFRYVHDFIYGYDWARWVSRAPQTRVGIGPYDPLFLQRMRDRATELVQLIMADDAAYPSLEPGVSRNPFRFSREPHAESALLLELARAGLIPVEAWRTDPVPEWNRPYAELREQRARELGLWMNESR